MTNAGHVYVIAFSDGTVKVGRTARVQVRIGQHKTAASKHGLTITGYWASGLHIESDINEETLKKSALKLGGTKVGTSREYFTGLRWIDVVAVAGRLPYTSPSEVPPCSTADRRSGNMSEAEKDARSNAVDALVRESMTEASQKSWRRTGRVISRDAERAA